MHDWINEYRTDGVARIQNVFTKNEMDELRCLSWRAFRSAGDSTIQWRGHFPALLFKPTGVDKFRADRRMADIARSILGENIVQLNNQIYFRLPGDGDQFGWHQDIAFRVPPDKFNRIETGYLQTAIIIDDMDAENGAIEYVKGSHLWSDLSLVPRDGSENGLRVFDRSKFNGEKITAKSGDVLVWSVMIVHGSEPNQSTRSRMYYMNGLAKSECVNGIEFPWYMRDGNIV